MDNSTDNSFSQKLDAVSAATSTTTSSSVQDPPSSAAFLLAASTTVGENEGADVSQLRAQSNIPLIASDENSNDEKNNEEKDNALTTSSTTQTSTNRSGEQKEEAEYFYLLYFDLWDSRRFQYHAPYYNEHLEGDAVKIGEGRTGPVYRKMIKNRDCVVKLLYLMKRRDELDGMKRVYPDKIKKELEREENAYEKLEQLQGDVIPVFLWHGGLLEDVVEGFATEYAGSELPAAENLTAAQVTSAKAALDAIHAEGVLHGDVELRNFLVKKGTENEVVVIDFAFSKFREEFESDEEWEMKVEEENKRLDSILWKIVTPQTDTAMEEEEAESTEVTPETYKDKKAGGSFEILSKTKLFSPTNIIPVSKKRFYPFGVKPKSP